MKPYYDKDGITIYNGDCLEVMKQFEDKSFDLVLTDPPYGINVKQFKRMKKALIGDDGMTVMFFLDELLKEVKRTLKLKGASYVFSRFDVYPYWWIKCKNYFEMKNCLIWDKGGGGVGDLKGNYFNNYEMVIFFTNGEHRLNGKREGTLMRFSKPKTSEVVHPTQKPIDLLEKLIEKSTNESDLILDPFMGSGSTLVAAKKLGRKAVGIEISEKYCEIAVNRLTSIDKKLAEYKKII